MRDGPPGSFHDRKASATPSVHLQPSNQRKGNESSGPSYQPGSTDDTSMLTHRPDREPSQRPVWGRAVCAQEASRVPSRRAPSPRRRARGPNPAARTDDPTRWVASTTVGLPESARRLTMPTRSNGASLTRPWGRDTTPLVSCPVRVAHRVRPPARSPSYVASALCSGRLLANTSCPSRPCGDLTASR